VETLYAAHKNGTGARYTRSHAPARLLGFEVHADRSSASQAEYRTKQLSPAEKRRYASALFQKNSPSNGQLWPAR
jgi:putative endonuclease